MTENTLAGKNPKSLVDASVELGRILTDRNRITFRAKGRCMYPTIRAGDVLRVMSRAAADVCLGDIAISRLSGYLLSHRVVKKGLRDGRAYIITRPDGAGESCDRPAYDEDLVGVVVSIERNGKPVPLLPTRYSRLLRLYFNYRFHLAEFLDRKSPHLQGLLARIQNSRAYRRIARQFLSVLVPRISYRVRIPMPMLGDAAFREFAPEDCDLRADWRGRPVRRWTLALNLGSSRQCAGWVTLSRENTEPWRVENAFVRVRYRGLGLDELLLHTAAAILRSSLGPGENSDIRRPAAGAGAIPAHAAGT